jgi:hypothetical protein
MDYLENRRINYIAGEYYTKMSCVLILLSYLSIELAQKTWHIQLIYMFAGTYYKYVA